MHAQRHALSLIWGRIVGQRESWKIYFCAASPAVFAYDLTSKVLIFFHIPIFRQGIRRCILIAEMGEPEWKANLGNSTIGNQK